MLLKKEAPAQWFLAGITLVAPWFIFVSFKYKYVVQMFAALVLVVTPIAIVLRSQESLLIASRSDAHQLIRVTPLSEGFLIREYARKQLYQFRFQLALVFGFMPVFWTTVTYAGDYPSLSFMIVAVVVATLNVVPVLLGVNYLVKLTDDVGARRAITLATVVSVAMTVLFAGLIVAGIFIFRGPCGHPFIEFGPALYYCF